MRFSPEKPFNELPLLPPKINTKDLAFLNACMAAHKELASLNRAELLIQNILINSIEAHASSRDINHIMTASAIKETLRCRTGLYQNCLALQKKPMDISIATEICSMILGVDINIRKIPGTAIVNDRTGKVIYTPPTGEKHLRDLLSNWQSYFDADDEGDPLIKLAIQHYQFEAIHPFADGNGRTGQILNLLFLIKKGLLNQPILDLRRYTNQKKEEYYHRLLEVTTKGKWKEWILFMIEAVYETAKWTKSKILAIQDFITNATQLIQTKTPSIYSKHLIEFLFIQPYVCISHLVEHKVAERQTASKCLKSLVEIGFLEEIKVGRETLFINRKFLNLLKLQ